MKVLRLCSDFLTNPCTFIFYTLNRIFTVPLLVLTNEVFWLFLIFDTCRHLITLWKPMSISEEMKLKAGILIPVVSGAFSSEETAH